MPTTWNMGATSMARNMVKVMKPPGVRVPAIICRVPTYITAPPTTPNSDVADRLINEIAVSDFSTLSNKRSTPPEKTRASSASAWYPLITRTPARDSVRRPCTSALIFPRSRKIGRIFLNALLSTSAKTAIKNSANAVIRELIFSRITSATRAFSMPPENSTSPVPIRLRTPSTSVMMRETSAPLLVAS